MLEPMLSLLGHRISANGLLFTRLCRLCQATVITVVEKSPGTETDHCIVLSPISHIITTCILPSLSCSGCYPFLSFEIWNMMKKMPFQLRFSIYSIWKGEKLGREAINQRHPDVVFAEVKALHSARAHFKRLSKDNTKEVGRLVSKTIYSNPLVVINYILGQIEAFDNLIPLIVAALIYSTDLAKDVMAFCLVEQLRKDEAKLKPGGTHYSDWFSSLSRFIASFYREYYDVELKGLLHFLLQQLSLGKSLDLLVLKDLLSQMGGCETVLEVSSKQLEGLAGGQLLKAELMGTQVNETPKGKAVSFLRKELMNSGTAMPLLLLIAQVRLKFV